MHPVSVRLDGPLTTARLTLRAWNTGDEPLFADLFAAPRTHRYLYTGPLTPEELSGRFTARLHPLVAVDDGSALRLAVEVSATRTFVGEVLLVQSSASNRQGEIGYVFLPAAAGCGYATEAAEALLGAAFEAGLHRVTARADARNAASVAVMRRLGMRHEATLRQNEWVKGEWTDEIVYAVLATEWAIRHAPAPASAHAPG